MTTATIYLLTTNIVGLTGPYVVHTTPENVDFVHDWQDGTKTSAQGPSCLKSYMFPTDAAARAVQAGMLEYEDIKTYVVKVTVTAP